MEGSAAQALFDSRLGWLRLRHVVNNQVHDDRQVE